MRTSSGLHLASHASSLPKAADRYWFHPGHLCFRCLCTFEFAERPPCLVSVVKALFSFMSGLKIFGSYSTGLRSR